MPKLIRISEAAAELNVSEKTIYNMIYRGLLRKFKKPVGNERVFVSAEDVERAKQPQQEE